MQALGLAALVIAIIIGLMALVFAICIRLGHYSDTRRATRLMRERGRLLAQPDFERRLAKKSGTVILELPTLGWRVLRAWWTPDDVAARGLTTGLSDQSPKGHGFFGSPLEEWCHDTYTDLEKGSALLVPLYLFGSRFQSYERSLRARYPSLQIVRVFSAGV